MVEKPPEEDGGGGGEEEPSNKPVMVEKRVCEVANACALKYEELMVIEAKEIQLTEDTLRQVSNSSSNGYISAQRSVGTSSIRTSFCCYCFHLLLSRGSDCSIVKLTVCGSQLVLL